MIFREQNVGYAVSTQKIYNVVANIKKNRMQGRNTVEEVLCLSAQRVTRSSTETEPTTTNSNDENVVICTNNGYDVQYAIVGGCRDEQSTTYRWTKCYNRPEFLHYLFNTWLNPLAHKFVMVWTGQVMHFGIETTNRVESEHLVMNLWLSTYHGDLDIVFLNIDLLIEGQITDIKSSLEFSRLKEKFNAKSNPILKTVSNKISHLALKKIWIEIKRAPEIIDDPKNKCGHYLRTSHEKNMNMDSEMRDLADLLDQISIGSTSKLERCVVLRKEY
ncbi:hypothetical protein M9H77_17301 [Catharanthus roseus]|uniref:Uncharacterized protein n=1 Tax=Catharanthus roseus TaxID=4058 RepID=A0ACC0B4K5_CATRO|nr:hypothetical protein M9H77_17301 [Catharanthus roseus]